VGRDRTGHFGQLGSYPQIGMNVSDRNRRPEASSAYGNVRSSHSRNGSGGPLQPEDIYGRDRGGTPSSNQDDWLHEPMPTYAERTRKSARKLDGVENSAYGYQPQYGKAVGGRKGSSRRTRDNGAGHDT